MLLPRPWTAAASSKITFCDLEHSKLLFCQLKHEIRRKTIEVALHRLDQGSGLNAIELRQIRIQHDPLASEIEDPNAMSNGWESMAFLHDERLCLPRVDPAA